MFPPRPTDLLHALLREVIRPGDTVIDATAGNGHDTVFLAQTVGQNGTVIAFDIQEQAIHSTADRLSREGLQERVELHQVSHSALSRFAPPDSAAVVVFNLGYLPGADHTLITESKTTLEALEVSTSILKLDGILAVVCYPGHPGGDLEASTVEDFFRKLGGFKTAKYQMISTNKSSPFLLIASKMAPKK